MQQKQNVTKIILLFLIAVMLLMTAAACGNSSQNAPSWQSQYDMGLRYLSDGKYEEAILAFNAAIEIDPKRVEAYIGRGNAYVGIGDAEENLAVAQADYELALELDPAIVDIYLGLADIYIARNDIAAALEILEQGYALTGDTRLDAKKAEVIQLGSIAEREPVTVTGHLIDNATEYRAETEALTELYWTDRKNTSFGFFMTGNGVRFDIPVIIRTDNGTEIIREARFGGAIPSYEEIPSLVGKTIQMEGFFIRSEKAEIIGPYEYEPGAFTVEYNPNGNYIFSINKYQELSE